MICSLSTSLMLDLAAQATPSACAKQLVRLSACTMLRDFALASLFVNAPNLTDVPEDLVAGPHRAALERANQAKFSQLQLEAYEKVRDEIRQVIEYSAARYAEGLSEGKLEGTLETLLRLLVRAKIPLSDDDQTRIKSCKDAARLDRWIENVIGATNAADVLV